MTEVKGDNKAALKFLRQWAPEGPWCLTAISPDKKSIPTATFTNDTQIELDRFIREHNGVNNVYFHVNPVKGLLRKKAERKDIKELAWLHVDIDPRAGEDIKEEQARALSLLQDNLPSGVPRPTVVVFSGGGYQGFWKLTEPLPINGEVEAFEDAKRYNQQLEVLFGADNCHNVDRIMRLPGTVNIPDARKRKKGRVPVLAELVSFDDKLVYDISEFKQAQPIQTDDGLGFSSEKKVEVSGNIRRIEDLDELNEWDVPDRVKVIIAQGNDPDSPKEGDNSRSAWLFDALCQLVRCSVPTDTIYALITDPGWDISESVLENKDPDRMAKRQIARAMEEVEDPDLRKMNEQFAVIGNIGGKCRIVEEQMDEELERSTLTFQSFGDFHNRFNNQHVEIGVTAQGKPITKTLGKYWTDHRQRRQYDRIVFSPAREVANAYNLWRGFAVQAKPGDCSLFLNHIRDIICGGNEEVESYLLGWLARAVQYPASQGEVAVVLRGDMGTGKGMFAKTVNSLFGRHALQVANSAHIVGNFNAHLRDCIMLFADEAFYANDKKHASVLKMLVTEETLPVESKGIDVTTAPNYIHLIMASNDIHVVPAGGHERRFLVLDVSDKHMQDAIYFSAMKEQLDNGGREALLHYLLNYDLTGYNVRQVPQTAALQEQKQLSLRPEEDWWLQKLMYGDLLPDADGWPQEVQCQELYDDYIETVKTTGLNRRGTEIAMGRNLSRLLGHTPKKIRKAVEVEYTSPDGWVSKKTRRLYHYIIPSLDHCRSQWERQFGVPDEGWLDPQQELY